MTDWKAILAELKTYKDIDYTRYPELTDIEKQLIEELLKNGNIDGSINLLEGADADRAWNNLQHRFEQPDTEARIVKLPSRAGRFLRKYAALMAFPLLVTGGYLYTEYSPLFSKPLSEYEFPATTPEGGVLILADGTEIALKDLAGNTSDRGFTVVDGKNLDYSDAQSVGEVEYNTLVVPKGADYRLTLSDGSQVHVNSDSKIKYPVRFANSGDRQIYLEKGEAFFDVARNEDQPFKVDVRGLDISVLGTSFNVNSYEETVFTTLIEGTITIPGQNGPIYIKPEQQVAYNSENKQVRITRVSTAPVIGWHYNQWVFEDAPLEDIMKSLSRTYDCDVVFVDDNARDLRFAINIDRYSNIEDILSLLEKTEKVRFTAKERRIYIHTNN